MFYVGSAFYRGLFQGHTLFYIPVSYTHTPVLYRVVPFVLLLIVLLVIGLSFSWVGGVLWT